MSFLDLNWGLLWCFSRKNIAEDQTTEEKKTVEKSFMEDRLAPGNWAQLTANCITALC